MVRLTEELKAEHAAIVAALERVKVLGVSTDRGRQTLLAAKEGLLAHLAREDESLYPALRSAAERNPRLRKLLDRFAEELEAVSEMALAFFERYAEADADQDFVRDFAKLFAALGSRIRREETALYPEYDKLESFDSPPLHQL